MSVDTSILTQQPAMSGTQLKELAGSKGLALRFMDEGGKPLDPDLRLDEPLYGQGYVLIGWPAADAETSAAVEQAMSTRDKPELDRLGMAGKFGWCSLACREFDFAQYEATLRADFEEFEDEDAEPVSEEALERLKPVKTQYSLSCGLRPKQCSQLLAIVAKVIQDATDGFVDE